VNSATRSGLIMPFNMKGASRSFSAGYIHIRFSPAMTAPEATWCSHSSSTAMRPGATMNFSMRLAWASPVSGAPSPGER